MVGVMMFGNAKRIDWTDYKLAVPAYCVLFFIPFTYSILRGVAFGYAIYIIISLYTGKLPFTPFPSPPNLSHLK
jgi:AGZA family xanthine/uracil permease-like MFS transporter